MPVFPFLVRKGLCMDGSRAPSDEPQPNGCEPQWPLRLVEPLPILVRGIDVRGEAFALETVVDHFSAHDFSIRVPYRLEHGVRLFAVVRLSLAPPEVPAARVALRGLVRQVDPLPDGRWGTAVRITRHRFL
jgi:hypothetical protein